jgi:predicted outer membrane repeat protein
MRRSNRLDGLRASLAHFPQPRARSPKKRRRVASRRPRFELLEERALLATLTVNSPLDNITSGNGLVTLREAIIAANTNSTTDLGQIASGADTIQFDPAVFGTSQTISLVFGELIITESLTINGPGRDVLTVDAEHKSRVFNITPDNGSYIFHGLTITRGMTSGEGGAIRSQPRAFFGGILTVDQCTVSNSSAAGNGGGIFSHSTLTVTGSDISGNSATGADAGGGGFFTDDDQTTVVSNSTISNNSARLGGGFLAAVELHLTDSVVKDNAATGDVGGFAVGSNFRGNRGKALLENATISGNRAVGFTGGFSANYATVTDSTISNNSVVGSAGGMRIVGRSTSSFALDSLVLVNSFVSGNSATVAGGGIFVEYQALITNTIVANNVGGGIFTNGPITLNSSTVTGNIASGPGGGISTVGAPGRPFGSGDVVLNSSTVQGNTSATNGGGIHTTRGNITLNSSTVSGNVAHAGGGVMSRHHSDPIYRGDVFLNASTVTGNRSATSGGGIYAGDVTLSSSTVSGNEAMTAGGGIYSRGLASIKNSTVTGNRAVSGAGGGLWNGDNSLEIFESIIAGNTAAGGGRDLLPGSGTLTVRNSLIGDNAGTPLVESHVRDANGNLIGSSAGAGVVNPRLGPLANNGGPTWTHALLAGSPAIDAIPVIFGPQPTHDYQLNGTLADTRGGPALDSVGGDLQATGYKFNANQGLNLSSALANPAQYSIEIVFRWDTLTGAWYKILDFHNLASDVGVYTTGNGFYFLDRAFAPGLFVPNTLAQIVITRDDATDIVRAYFNGALAWSFVDSAGLAVFDGPNQIMRFFQDDTATGQTQAQAGFVDRVRIYSQVLSEAEVNAITAPPPFTVPEFDQRGQPFQRVRDGDGIGGAQMDMGAYELHAPLPPPSVDFGDAPDAGAGTGLGNYNTLVSDNGPSHTIVAGLRMGAQVDGDSGTLQNAAANADDVNGALPDDEDGVSYPATDLVLTVGAQPTVNVRVTNMTGSAATLYGWIDYNGNGVFDNATERANVAVPNGTNNNIFTLVFPAVPRGFTGTTYARFRLSTDPLAANPTGPAGNGEVEDYLATIIRPSDLTADSSKTKVLAAGINGVPVDANNFFGTSVASIGDLDGDGVSDMAVGAVRDNTGGQYRGAVYVLLMNADGTVKSSTKIAHNLNGGPALTDIDLFGVSIASLGDLDGDGVADLAVGANNNDTGGLNRGAVHILFMRSDGTVKSRGFIADSTGGGPSLSFGAGFGTSVTSLGDLDGDGIADIAVGAFGEHSGTGAVYVVFMNANGTAKGSQKIGLSTGGGPSLLPFDGFGVSIASLGDLDGDGVTELAVGAAGDDLHVNQGGAIYVLSLTVNGTAKSIQKIASGIGGGPTIAPGDFFGASLTILGDIDGDGVTDLASAQHGGHRAIHMLLLNTDGTVKRSRIVPNSTDDGTFGLAITSLGDLDGDGLTDLAVGSQASSGTVYVLFLKAQNANPVFTSPGALSVVEHSAFVMNVTASDSDVPPQTVTFALVGGADQAKFTITPGGSLSFVTPPDFTVPTDANGDNVYEVIVQASDGNGGIATQTVRVTVVGAQVEYDYGDAPDTGPGTGRGNYNTRRSDDGAWQRVDPNIKIGPTVDGEGGELQNTQANADDAHGVPDDEDGVVNPAADLVMTIGSQPTVNVRVTNIRGPGQTGNELRLFGFIDYDADGRFENYATLDVPDGTNNRIFTLVFPVVPPGFTGTTYVRFRVSIDAYDGSPIFGTSAPGEIEDYPIIITQPSDGTADSAKTKKIAASTNGGPALVNGDMFGAAVAAIGDLDGDGIEDMAVGAPSQTGSGNAGAVFIQFMNADGTVKASQRIASGVGGGPTTSAGDYFGHSVAAIGDLDGDGVNDLAVGASKDDTGGYISGAVYVLFMNSNGTVKASQKIASGVGGGPTLSTGDRFGTSVTSIGDLDGDGVSDLAVGAAGDDAGGSYRGALHVLFMNAGGTVKASQKIASGVGGGPVIANLDFFGGSVANLGDLDGDGITELAVGASGDDTGGTGRGAAYILFLNSNGTVKTSRKIASGIGGAPVLADGDYFGRSVASLGDLDGDGVTDLAVGAYRDNTGGSDRGGVHVLFLGANGTVKGREKIAQGIGGGPNFANDDRFGSSIAALGDLDGDGVIELAVGAETDNTGGSDRGAVYTLFLRPGNRSPVITAPAAVSVPENSSAVMTVTASDADVPPQTISFSIIGGADQSKFTISSGGTLSFNTPPNFEAPTDVGGNNVYEVTVQASDGAGGAATQSLMVTVTPLNDNRPVITSPDAVSVPENTTTVLTVTATDADLPPQTLTYSIVGGVDLARFNITTSGLLSFNTPPNFEAPSDANGDNVYVVIVQASDGSLPSVQAILVTVTNVVSEPLVGDYNNNGVVDLADYVLWRNGGPLQNEGASPGAVTLEDYGVWRANFGRTAPAVGAASGLSTRPQPTTADLLGVSSLEPPATRATSLLDAQTFARPSKPAASPARAAARRPASRSAFALDARDDALVAWLALRQADRQNTTPHKFADWPHEISPDQQAARSNDAFELAFAAIGTTGAASGGIVE